MMICMDHLHLTLVGSQSSPFVRNLLGGPPGFRSWPYIQGLAIKEFFSFSFLYSGGRTLKL